MKAMNAQKTISLKEDYLSFKKDVTEIYGHSFAETAAVFFERAIEESNKGLTHSAIETASFALKLADYSNDYVAVYINSFLAQHYLEVREFHMAISHCLNAIELLDEQHEDYREDHSYLQALQNTIEGGMQQVA